MRRLDYVDVRRYATTDQAVAWLKEQGIDEIGEVYAVELAEEGAVDVEFYADGAGEPTSDWAKVAVTQHLPEGAPAQYDLKHVVRRVPVSRIPEWWPLGDMS